MPVQARYVRPKLTAYQLDALFCPERYAVVEATTKAGKTVGAMAWLAEQAFLEGGPGRNYWWVAPIFPQARIAFRRMKRQLIGGDARFPAVQANETEATIRLPNGATLWFKGSDKPDSLYGEDVYGAVIDEASRCREEAWHAVRSTLTATRGAIRIIGNVKGRRNWAYHLARRAEAGEPGMHYAKITAWDAVDAGILSREEVEDARRVLPPAVFDELYLGIPSDDGGNPFGLAAIRACVGPISPDPPAWWGWDLAKAVDWTVGIGLDARSRVAGFERFQRPWQETIASVVGATGGRPALVDSTGVGDPILEALQRTGGRFEGFRFTAQSKQQLMEGLAVAVQRGEVTFPDGPIRIEMESFEYEYTRSGVRYSAPEGAHDDCVCALALALRSARVPQASVWFA